jgi:hypothetical protein
MLLGSKCMRTSTSRGQVVVLWLVCKAKVWMTNARADRRVKARARHRPFISFFSSELALLPSLVCSPFSLSGVAPGSSSLHAPHTRTSTLREAHPHGAWHAQQAKRLRSSTASGNDVHKRQAKAVHQVRHAGHRSVCTGITVLLSLIFGRAGTEWVDPSLFRIYFTCFKRTEATNDRPSAKSKLHTKPPQALALGSTDCLWLRDLGGRG